MAEQIELEDGFLFNVDDVPQQVKRKATAYRKAIAEKNDGLAAFNTAKDNLIESMKEHDCEACMVEVDGKRKIVRLTQEDKIKIEKPVNPPEAAE
jgi:hypothetical protein